jgi:hypothetical protein
LFDVNDYKLTKGKKDFQFFLQGLYCVTPCTILSEPNI